MADELATKPTNETKELKLETRASTTGTKTNQADAPEKDSLQQAGSQKMEELADTLLPLKKEQAREQPIPESINRRFDSEVAGDTTKYFHRGTDKEALRTTNSKIVVRPESARTVAEEATALADSKGWSSIKVSGSKDFRRKVWEQGTLRGIEVEGYNPSEKELEELKGKANTIEQGGTAHGPSKATKDNTLQDQLTESFNNEPKAEAIAKYPELKQLYSLQQSAREFADERIGDSENRSQFVDAIVDRGMNELSKGNNIPELKTPKVSEMAMDVGR